MKMLKRNGLAALLTIALILSCLSVLPLTGLAAENLALNKTGSASGSASNPEFLTDGNTHATTGGEATVMRKNSYAMVDLGEEKEINMVKVYEYNSYKSRRLHGYTLEVSSDGSSFTKVAEADENHFVCPDDVVDAHYSGTITFEKTKARYVKLTVKMTVDARDPSKESVVGYIEELEVYLDESIAKDEANTGDNKNKVYGSAAPKTNLAANKTVTSNPVRESGDQMYVVDGDKNISVGSAAWQVRANSNAVIDLGEVVSFNQINLYEYNSYRENRIFGYSISYSQDGKSNWISLAESGYDQPACPTEREKAHYTGTVNFEKVNARYVRVLLKRTASAKDPGKSVVGYLEEIEVYYNPDGGVIDNPSQPGVVTPTPKPTATATPAPSVVTGDNLALNCKIFTDFAYSTVDAAVEHVVDGDKNTRLKVNGNKGQKYGHFILDLGAQANFSQIRVNEYSDKIKSYELYTSNDQASWTKIAEGGALGKEGVISFEAVSARYVMLKVTETLAGLSISEISVYNGSGKPNYENNAVPQKEIAPTLSKPEVVDSVPYSKDKFHIYLFIGQSNMNGRDIVPPEEMVKLNNAYLFNGDGKWEKAQPWVDTNSKFPALMQGFNRYSTVVAHTTEAIDGLNFASSFARAMTGSLGDDVGIGIVSNARGGTSIGKWQKNSGYEYDLYGEAVKRAKAAIDAGGTLKGIFWLQGCGDANTEDYLGKLNNIATGLRSELGVTEEVPFIASMNPPSYIVNNDRIVNIGSAVANSDWVSSAGTSTIDGTHFTSDSMHLLGIRFAVKALDKVYGIKTDEYTLNQKVYNNDLNGYIARAGKTDYPITVNGMSLVTDTAPVMVNDRILVPLRAIFERLGAAVEWDDPTQTVTATKNGKTIVLTIGNKVATVNGETRELDVEAQLVQDRTMVPIRFVSESLGAEVRWEESVNTVNIIL